MKKSLGSFFMGDRVIWAIFFFLCAISLIEVFSAVSSLAFKSGNYWAPIGMHACFLLGGTVVAWIVHCVPCRYFRLLPVLTDFTAIVLLLIVLVKGAVVNDASRWIDLGMGIHFQPSELAKCGVVMTTALILSSMQTEEGADPKAIRWILFVTLVIGGLIFTENLSTAAIICVVVFLQMFIGRVPLVQLGKLLGVTFLVGGLAVGSLWLVKSMDPDQELGKLPVVGKVVHRGETWVERIEDKFVQKEEDKDPMKYDIDGGAQVAHANIAIASSNFVGKMPGNSTERDFLSQAFSDFIFAIVVEELGLWGGAIVVLLYVFLLFRVGRLANQCERSFPAFLAIGFALLLVVQAMVNMLVAVGLMPVTGQPLPLISRGGTSTLINCFYIGAILSVSRYAKQASEPAHTVFDGPMKGVLHEQEKK